MGCNNSKEMAVPGRIVKRKTQGSMNLLKYGQKREMSKVSKSDRQTDEDKKVISLRSMTIISWLCLKLHFI